MSTLVRILIAPSPESPMRSVDAAEAVAGRGLEGDRYFHGTGTFSPRPEQKPDFEVTLIEEEKIQAFASRSGLAFTAESARRNLVTRGVDLNALVGVEFRVGSVMLRGMRLCEPCQYLAKATFAEVLPGLVHQGGLRARIVAGGTLRVGAAIAVASDPR